MSRYQCECLSSESLPDWERFVLRSPRGAIYYLNEYVSLLGQYTGGTARTLVVRDGAEILCGVTLLLRKSRGGVYVENRTFLYYNGVLGNAKFDALSESSLREVVQVLCEAIEREGLDSVTLHTSVATENGAPDLRPWSAAGWNVSPTYTFILPLVDVMKRMDKNFRRLVRRAEDAGFTCGADDDVESLFALHSAIHDRKDAPLYLPRESFIAFVKELRLRRWADIYHARTKEGEPAASLLILKGPWKTVHAVVAGSAKEHLTSGAAPFVRLKSAEALASEGREAIDLTDASIESVSRFKRDCGGVLKMNFVLRSPTSRRWKLWEAIQRWR